MFERINIPSPNDFTEEDRYGYVEGYGEGASKQLDACNSQLPEIIKEAKREERERIVRDIETFNENLVDYDEGHREFRKMVTGQWLQALKESK